MAEWFRALDLKSGGPWFYLEYLVIYLQCPQLALQCQIQGSMIFTDFRPSNIVKFENVGPTFPSFRPLLSYSYVATTVVNNFRD